MSKRLLRTTAFALAGALFGASAAMAAPARGNERFAGFTDEVDTAPQPPSRRQPLTRARGGPKAFEAFEEQLDMSAPMQSRHQRISHTRNDPAVFEEKVDLIAPPPRMRWR